MADNPNPSSPVSTTPAVPVKAAVTGAAAMSYLSGGSYGQIPQFDSGMTFGEYGSAGLRAFSGWVREEFLPQLQGRQAAQKYREMMDNSPVVGAIMYAINSTMRKVEWRVTPAGDEDAEPNGEAKEAADFLESCMDDMTHPWEDLISENLSMLGYGYAPHEIVYKLRNGRNPGNDKDGKQLPKSEYEDGLIGWRKIPLRGQDTVLKWFFDPNGEIMGMTQLPWTGPMVDLPIEKMLLFRPTQHKNNPEGKSILRTAYLPYYFTKRLQEQEAIVGERMGGIPIMYIPASVFENAAANDANAIRALATYKKIATNVRIDEQMGIVLPSDCWPGTNGGASTQKMFEFKLEAPNARIGNFEFDKTINRYNVGMTMSVMADFLTLGHEARGTQSLAVSKVDMFFQAIEGFLNSMAGVYNRHAIPRLWELNGFDYDNKPKIEPDLAQRVDLDVLSNYVLRLSQSGMPLFPNEDLQTYILDAAGLPDVVDDRALQAAGLLDDQLDVTDEKSQVQLDQMKNPPDPNTPYKGKTPLEKMLLRELARRVIKHDGPKFGVHTHVHKRKRKR